MNRYNHLKRLVWTREPAQERSIQSVASKIALLAFPLREVYRTGFLYNIISIEPSFWDLAHVPFHLLLNGSPCFEISVGWTSLLLHRGQKYRWEQTVRSINYRLCIDGDHETRVTGPICALLSPPPGTFYLYGRLRISRPFSDITTRPGTCSTQLRRWWGKGLLALLFLGEYLCHSISVAETSFLIATDQSVDLKFIALLKYGSSLRYLPKQWLLV